MITQTVQLAFRIAFVWAGGFLLAVAVYAILPSSGGLSFPGRQGTHHVISFNRLGFWTCILAALTVTFLVVIRAMFEDFSPGSVG